MRSVKKDSTDQSVVIRIIDSTDGTPENAVEHNTAGIDLWYRREGATKTSIVEVALAALDSVHLDGGIELIGDGYYRLDPPDAAFATGANGVMIGGTVTGMIVIGTYIPLIDYDPQDTVRLGLTALPNAAADAAGGLPISDAGGLDLDTKLANTNEITAARMGALTDLINGERLDLLIDQILADTNELQTDWANGGRLDNLIDAIPTTAMRGTDSATLAATWTDARAAYLDNLSAGAVALAAGVDLTSIHGVALTETIDGYLAAAFTKLFDVATPLLVASDVMRGTDSAALAATALSNVTWTDAKAGHIDAPISTVDTVVDGIQTDLSNATDGLGALKALIDTIDGIVDTILIDTNDLQTNQGAWLTATGFSTHSAADVKTAIEAAGSSIATILADTNELQTDWANGGRLDLLIDAILTDTGTTLDTKLDTILGLNQENFFIDTTTYSGGNMTGARIRIYSVAGSVGTASDVIATYTITATYAGSEMTDYKVVKS